MSERKNLTIPRDDLHYCGLECKHLLPSICDQLFADENPVLRVEMGEEPWRDSYSGSVIQQ